MRRPLRIGTRWTLFNAAVMLATILVIGAFLYVRIEHRILAEARLVLESYVAELEDELDRPGAYATSVMPALAQRLVALDPALEPSFAAFTPDGVRIAATGILAQRPGDLPQALLAGRTAETTLALRDRDDQPLLLTAKRDRVGYVEVAIRTHRFTRVINEVRRTFAIALPLAILITIAGGRWLARASLRPISDMTAVARSLGADRLDLSVPMSGSSDELDQLASAFNTMIGRIREAMEKLRRVSLGAAHQLKSPLASLRSQIEVALETEPMDDASRRRLERILAVVVDMSEGVSAMMRLARSEAGLSPEQIKPVELGEMLASIGAIFEPMARERDIALRIEAPGPAVVLGDPAWLSQLFGNVIDNAIRYTQPGGRVEVALERDGPAVAVRIADDGEGIPTPEIERVFERFHRVARGRETPGWGLGLAIAWEIARSHGGSIAAESTPGVGSVFTVRLPLLDDGRAPSDPKDSGGPTA